MSEDEVGSRGSECLFRESLEEVFGDHKLWSLGDVKEVAPGGKEFVAEIWEDFGGKSYGCVAKITLDVMSFADITAVLYLEEVEALLRNAFGLFSKKIWEEKGLKLLQVTFERKLGNHTRPARRPSYPVSGGSVRLYSPA